MAEGNQRGFASAHGFKDLNDHETVREGQFLQTTVRKKPDTGEPTEALPNGTAG